MTIWHPVCFKTIINITTPLQNFTINKYKHHAKSCHYVKTFINSILNWIQHSYAEYIQATPNNCLQGLGDTDLHQ